MKQEVADSWTHGYSPVIWGVLGGSVGGGDVVQVVDHQSQWLLLHLNTPERRYAYFRDIDLETKVNSKLYSSPKMYHWALNFNGWYS